MDNMKVQKYSLEDLIEQRNQALKDVRESGRKINRKLQQLFEPPKTNGKLDLFANNIDRIIAVYDGVLLGTRIIRKVRRLVIRK